MQRIVAILSVLIALASPALRVSSAEPADVFRISTDVLEDKIRGGMLAQVIGNLNGLPHEFKYINEPGNVSEYTPSLPDGARTDDDTDIEWVYLSEIARSKQNFLGPDRIAALWKRHINRKIWCANEYARGLMDLGIEPPWTGNLALNPWSEFNISGQFVCESFGLMAPAMPQTAARLGLNYTHAAIDGEPAQTTQLFTTMIATAFVQDDIYKILDAGLAAVDPNSNVSLVVAQVRKLHRENPDDWKATRQQVKDAWQKQGGVMRERNGYELNTASTVAALLYGHGDFVETLRIAFNFGWDADNNAATSATIVGVIRGRRWMDQQGWKIKDVYRNTTRDDMPGDETLTGLEDKAIAAARITIDRNGGEHVKNDRTDDYLIRMEQPANVQKLASPGQQYERARKELGPQIARELTSPGVGRARAAYLAICLDDPQKLKAESPDHWSAALAELEKNYPAIVANLFNSPGPYGDRLRERAEAAGLHKPSAK